MVTVAPATMEDAGAICSLRGEIEEHCGTVLGPASFSFS